MFLFIVNKIYYTYDVKGKKEVKILVLSLKFFVTLSAISTRCDFSF